MAKIDSAWSDDPIDVTDDSNFIWSIANNLRGTYMPDKYGDVIIPMTILRRFECVLEPTKDTVISEYEKNKNIPPQVLQEKSGFEFYNTSHFSLKELCNDEDKNLKADFESYIDNFSSNVQEIFKQLKLKEHIKTMDEGGCLYQVIDEFSKLDLSVEHFDSIRMGYIFENLIGRFYQNVDAGQFYTGRDIIKLMVSILISEGCEDLQKENKVVTICDQACGTGGMLTTAYNYLKNINPSLQISLYGQEFMATTYAIGLAEMLIKGQKSKNFRNADTFKEDCFPDRKMRFVLENPPFGTPWKGKKAKDGQEKAVLAEYEKEKSRWGAGLPAAGDSQLIFMQSAINKLDDKNGRAAIIQNGSSLFKGDTSSGESKIRKWMLQNDLIESIIALPSDLFYNTPISTYIWIISKNKRSERKGKVQLINASSICHKLRKPAGKKRNEIYPEDREYITKLYTDFENNDLSRIYDNEDFLYREYVTKQPFQKNYAITNDRIDQLKNSGKLINFYDENKLYELTNSEEKLSKNDVKKIQKYLENEDKYKLLISRLEANTSETIYKDQKEFKKKIDKVLPDFDNNIRENVVKGLGITDKSVELKYDRNGNVVYDDDGKYTEIVPYKESIDEYMKREVYPYMNDAKAFFEDDENGSKIGAEIPFMKIFYEYEELEDSSKLLGEFKDLHSKLDKKIENMVEKKWQK